MIQNHGGCRRSAQAEIVRIDDAAEAGLDPYPIAAREQQRRAHLTDIIRRHDA